MTRAGRDGDGGYVLPAAEMRDCDALLSLGVNDDWSFEQAFHAVRPRPVDAYDPTVSRVGFLLRALKPLLVAPIALLRRPRPLVRRIARECFAPWIRSTPRVATRSVCWSMHSR
jgi:hypothetical protein